MRKEEGEGGDKRKGNWLKRSAKLVGRLVRWHKRAGGAKGGDGGIPEAAGSSPALGRDGGDVGALATDFEGLKPPTGRRHKSTAGRIRGAAALAVAQSASVSSRLSKGRNMSEPGSARAVQSAAALAAESHDHHPCPSGDPAENGSRELVTEEEEEPDLAAISAWLRRLRCPWLPTEGTHIHLRQPGYIDGSSGGGGGKAASEKMMYEPISSVYLDMGEKEKSGGGFGGEKVSRVTGCAELSEALSELYWAPAAAAAATAAAAVDEVADEAEGETKERRGKEEEGEVNGKSAPPVIIPLPEFIVWNVIFPSKKPAVSLFGTEATAGDAGRNIITCFRVSQDTVLQCLGGRRGGGEGERGEGEGGGENEKGWIEEGEKRVGEVESRGTGGENSEEERVGDLRSRAPAVALFSRFFAAEEEEEVRRRFKLIAKVQDKMFTDAGLSWLSGYNGKPRILANSGQYWTAPFQSSQPFAKVRAAAAAATSNTDCARHNVTFAADYLEICVDVTLWTQPMGLPLSAGWSMKDYLKDTEFTLAFTVEGREEEDLPERVVAGIIFQKMDFNAAAPAASVVAASLARTATAAAKRKAISRHAAAAAGCKGGGAEAVLEVREEDVTDSRNEENERERTGAQECRVGDGDDDDDGENKRRGSGGEEENKSIGGGAGNRRGSSSCSSVHSSGANRSARKGGNGFWFWGSSSSSASSSASNSGTASSKRVSRRRSGRGDRGSDTSSVGGFEECLGAEGEEQEDA